MLQMLIGVIRDARLQRDVTGFEGGLGRVSPRAGYVLFHDRLSQRSCDLHILPALSEPKPSSGVRLEISRRFISSHRCNVLIIPDSNVLVTVPKGCGPSGLGCWQIIKRVTSFIINEKGTEFFLVIGNVRFWRRKTCVLTWSCSKCVKMSLFEGFRSLDVL
jgi:hypothetical protein